MNFQGLNKRIDPNDMEPGFSPDTSNAFLHDGKIGLLGPRKGKTFFNTTKYDNNTNAILQFYTPGRKKWLVCDDNGAVTQRDPAFDYATETLGLTRRVGILPTPLSLTVTAPTTTGNTTDSFATALPAMDNNMLVAFFMPKIGLTLVQADEATPVQGNTTISLGLVTSVGGVRWHQAFTANFDYDKTANDGSGNSDINLTVPHERIGNRLIIGDAYQSGDGTITGIGVKIDVTWAGQDTGTSVTVSDVSAVLELDD